MPSLTDWGKKVLTKGGGGGGKFVQNKKWKDAGSFKFWLHPDAMIDDREQLVLPVAFTNDDGEKKITWVRRFFSGDKDIAARFLAWLEDQDDIDDDDVVFRVKSGKEKKSFTKGEVLGLKGYGYQGEVLRPRQESVFCVVPNDEPGQKFLAIPITAGQKVFTVIQSQMDDDEDKGDPRVNPYALKITYDAKANGKDKYDVNPSIQELSDEVSAIFQEDPLDVEAECDPAREKTENFGTTAEILKAMCVVPCPVFDEEPEEDETKEDPDEMPDNFGSSKSEETDDDETEETEEDETEGDDDETEETDDGEEGEEEGETIDPIEAGDAEIGESYTLEDDEEVTCKKKLKKHVLFVEDDGTKHKLKHDDSVWPAEEDEDETDDDDGEGLKVRDCEPGEVYIDSDDDELTFIKFDDDEDHGVFEDSDGDTIALDGDDPVKKK